MAVYAHINSVPNGSTGRIMLEEHNDLLSRGEKSVAFWGRRSPGNGETSFNFGSPANFFCDVALTYVDGRAGFHSKRQTKKLLDRLDRLGPNVIHLHNLHGYYLNIEMLFEWIQRHDCNVVWTLHDCWAFTGHCVHFTSIGCERWKHCGDVARGCNNSCGLALDYPPTFCKSASAWNFAQKRRLFTSIPADRMRLIVPSLWLKNHIEDSFLSKYAIEVRPNTVDNSIFKPIDSNFRSLHGIGSRFVVMGVADPWSERKGLGIFFRLASDLDPSLYSVVLIGLNKKQIKRAPKNVVALPRTDSVQELAEAYSAADLLLNPSVEETFGMTVAEANSCGTRALVMRGSACEEAASPGMAIVSMDDYADIKAAIELEYRNVERAKSAREIDSLEWG